MMRGIIVLLENWLKARKKIMQYEVKDSAGNVVATFTSADTGPFVVQPVAQTNGGPKPADPV